MNIDPTSLTISLLLGLIGLGYVLYARNAKQLLPAATGVGLMVCPYVIPNLIVLLIVCAVLIAAPFFFRGTYS